MVGWNYLSSVDFLNELQWHLLEAVSLVLPTLDTWFLTEIDVWVSPRGSF